MKKREKLIKSEIIEMFETTKEALRHYENVGLLNPEVDDKNYRYYGYDDMARLRQIFVLKDLGFQLEEMKLIMNKDVSKDKFSTLLMAHNDLLKRRIQQYKDIQNNIGMVLQLLEDETYDMTFNLRHFDCRHYYMLDSQEILEDSPKDYYDRFKKIIHENYYNERVLVSCFDYKTLDAFDSSYSKFCFSIEERSVDLLENEPAIIKRYDKGMYLSVFHVYKHGEKQQLIRIKKSIDDYISSHQLIIEDDEALEFEHPELGMLLEAGETLYEIQIKVRYDKDER